MSCAITVYVGIRMKTRGAGKWQPSTPSCGRGPVHSWPRVTLVQPTPQPSALGVGVPHERATNPPCSRRTTSSSRVAGKQCKQCMQWMCTHLWARINNCRAILFRTHPYSANDVLLPPPSPLAITARAHTATCRAAHTSPTPTPPDCSIVTHRLSLESELQNFKTI
jgi:hypothetical protein